MHKFTENIKNMLLKIAIAKKMIISTGSSVKLPFAISSPANLMQVIDMPTISPERPSIATIGAFTIARRQPGKFGSTCLRTSLGVLLMIWISFLLGLMNFSSCDARFEIFYYYYSCWISSEFLFAAIPEFYFLFSVAAY